MSKGLRKKKNALKCIDKPVYRPLVEELLLRFEDDLTPDIQFTPIRSEEKKEQDMAANLEVSIAFLNRRRSHSAFFFYEMISRWLIPLKKSRSDSIFFDRYLG